MSSSESRNCLGCRWSVGGNKRSSDGAWLFCQNPKSWNYVRVVAPTEKCGHWEGESVRSTVGASPE